MKWFALLACLLLTTSAGARIDDPEDFSKPELVKRYIFLPCGLLKHSVIFQNKELQHLSAHLDNCYAANKKHPEYPYGPVLCLYVKMQWELMFNHVHSSEKAWELMCDEDGQRSNPEYDIEF